MDLLLIVVFGSLKNKVFGLFLIENLKDKIFPTYFHLFNKENPQICKNIPKCVKYSWTTCNKSQDKLHNHIIYKMFVFMYVYQRLMDIMWKGDYWIEYISTKVTYLSHWCLMAMIKYSFNLLAIDTIHHTTFILNIYIVAHMCDLLFYEKREGMKKVVLLHTDENYILE